MLAWLWTRLSESGPQVAVSGRALRRFPEREVDRLLRARVLIERRKADHWSVCAHCDCGLDARPIRRDGEELRACCPYDAAEDVVLEEDDLRRFGIAAERLAATIAASGGLGGEVASTEEEVWSIGTSPTGVAIVLCSDPQQLERPGVILAIKAAVGARRAVLVSLRVGVPATLRLEEAGISTRQLADVARQEDGRDGFDFEDVPASPGAVRLVLHRSVQSAILDGRRLNLPLQMFALFRLLVEQVSRREPVLRKETIEAETGRPANEIVRDLRQALTGCGLTPKEAGAVVTTVRGYGYELGLSAAAVSIED